MGQSSILVNHGWSTLFVLILVYLLARFVRNFLKLRHIPGPFVAVISDVWRYVHCMRGHTMDEYKLHREYNSPLLRLGPNTVSVSDPTAIKTIYGMSPIYTKGYLYVTHQFMSKDGTVMNNLSSTRDEKVHARLRRSVNHAYALSNLLDYEKLMDRTTEVFFRELTERFVVAEAECDLATWLQMYAFDVLGEITFSKRFGFLEAGQDVHDMLHHTAQHMEYLGTMGQFPYLDEWFRLRNPVLRNLRKPNAIVSFSVKQMDEHAQNKDEDAPPDFVDRFKAAAEKYSDVMTQEQMEDFVITNVSAGSDTTAIILRATIYFLLTDKLRYNEFMKEVKTTLKARPRNETHHRHISWTEAYNMRYFQAVLKESMRLHPALGQILPRIVPKGGVHLCGKFLPEGTEVGCNAWTVHHDRAIFGEDADTFRPERWLDNDEEKVKNMERHNFVFGAGSRTCIGRHVAMLELSKLIPEFFRIFEVSLIDPKRYKDHCVWLVVQSGLDVMLKLRDRQVLLED